MATGELRSDGSGHCRIEFRVRDGPTPAWRATVGGFVVEAGGEMTSLAESIQAFTSHQPEA